MTNEFERLNKLERKYDGRIPQKEIERGDIKSAVKFYEQELERLAKARSALDTDEEVVRRNLAKYQSRLSVIELASAVYSK